MRVTTSSDFMRVLSADHAKNHAGRAYAVSDQAQNNPGNPFLGALGGMQLGSKMKWGGN